MDMEPSWGMEHFDISNQERLESMLDSARTLFVGDLSFLCTEEDLRMHFAPYGPVSIRIRKGLSGESLMHGFIALESPEAARWAIAQLDGVEFMGRKMRVQLSSDEERPDPNKHDKFIQLHVSFISRQVNMLITEKVLRDVFAAYGEIADVVVKKHSSTSLRQSGYGFVYFCDVNSAYHAVSALKHSTVMDITFDCSVSHKSESMIRQQLARQRGSPQSDYAAQHSMSPAAHGQYPAPLYHTVPHRIPHQPLPPMPPVRPLLQPMGYGLQQHLPHLQYAQRHSPDAVYGYPRSPYPTYAPRSNSCGSGAFIAPRGLAAARAHSYSSTSAYDVHMPMHGPPRFQQQQALRPTMRMHHQEHHFSWPTVSVDEYGDGTPHGSFYQPSQKVLSDLTEDLSEADLVGTFSSLSGLGGQRELVEPTLEACPSVFPFKGPSTSSIATAPLNNEDSRLNKWAAVE